jgi:hypothetical protein
MTRPMLRKLRRVQRNPLIAVRYALQNPKRVAIAVGSVIAVGLLLTAGLALDLIPDWTMLFGIAVLTAFGTYVQYNRAQFLMAASEVAARQVQPGAGAVKISGTAQPAGEDRVGHDEPEHLAYRHKRERDRNDHQRNDELLGDEISDVDSDAVPFYVADDSGQVLVDASRATLDLDWEDKSRKGGWTEYYATLNPGDEVNVYGTALTPDEHSGSELVEAFSNNRSEAPTETFSDHAADESVVVSSTPADPQFVVSDRAGWSLLGRTILWAVAAALATVGLIALGIGAALGVLPW